MTVLTLSMLNVVFNTMPVAASPRQRALCRNRAKWRAMEMFFFNFGIVLRKFQNFWCVGISSLCDPLQYSTITEKTVRAEKGEAAWKLAIETLADLLTELDRMKF